MSATNVLNDFALKLYNKLAAGKRKEKLFSSGVFYSLESKFYLI
jgi:hypothetical protein